MPWEYRWRCLVAAGLLHAAGALSTAGGHDKTGLQPGVAPAAKTGLQPGAAPAAKTGLQPGAAPAAKAVADATPSLQAGIKASLQAEKFLKRALYDLVENGKKRAASALKHKNETLQKSLQMVHVVYASDFGLMTSLLSGMISVARNTKEPHNVVIHLIAPLNKLTTASRLTGCFYRELERLNKTAPSVQIHPVKMNHPIELGGRFTWLENVMGVTRLFLHEYLEAPRAIWLDTDTVVTSDIAQLYRVPMEHAVAAVREPAPRSFRVLYPTQNWGLLRQFMPNPDLLVFNAGVMVFDLQRWRAEAISRDLRNWCSILKSAGPQLLINLVAQVGRNFTELDWQWNVFGLAALFPPRLEQAQQGRVLHWSGRDKPWNRPPNPSLQKLEGAIHKAGVRLPDTGREKFDFLLMPYMPRTQCGEPSYAPI